MKPTPTLNPRRMLPLADLILDPAFQQREDGLDEVTVRRYMEVLDKLPAPVVFFDAQQDCYYLPGGFHRYEAHRRAKREEMPCEVRKGDWLDAFVWSLAENAEHGLPRREGDVKKAILAAFSQSDKEQADWSDEEVARMCRCSVSYVKRIRASLKPRVEATLPPIRPVMSLVDGKIQTIPAGPKPNLSQVEKEAIGREVHAEDARWELARGLESVTRGLACLNLLEQHRSTLQGIRESVWGKEKS